jgi:hypothetical protein
LALTAASRTAREKKLAANNQRMTDTNRRGRKRKNREMYS